MLKTFSAPRSQDLKIMNGDKVFGALRVKPSALLWKTKGAHSWKRVSIEAFARFAKKNGTEAKK